MLGGKRKQLRKVSLDAFEGHDETSKDVDDSRSNKRFRSSNDQIDSEEDLSEQQLDVIIKTAVWVANNPTQVDVLLQKARSTPELSFLINSNSSVAGKRYLKELNRITAERSVRSVCADVPTIQEPKVIPSHPVTEIHQPQQQVAVRKRSKWGPPTNTSASQQSVAPLNNALRTEITSQTTTLQQQQRTPGTSRRFVSKKVSDAEVEAAKIAELAATFDDFDQSQDNSVNSTKESYSRSALGASNNDPQMQQNSRMQKLLEEQKELKFLEQTIREASQQQLSQGRCDTGAITQLSAELGQAEFVSSLSEEQAELYLERLQQYKELASRDMSRKDTIEDAERNGGIIDGGTWEHRKRAQEMLNTAATNISITTGQLVEGKRHMADYLPPEVLQQFLRKADAVKTGVAPPAEEDKFASNKLDAGNMGFQLLQKSGWKEGSGLGAAGTGITVPITSSSSGGNHSGEHNSDGDITVPAGPIDRSVTRVQEKRSNGTGIGSTAAEGGGIGTRATHEVDAADDEFDTYRKRMMLAYRFRPNPLNNPRRNYY